MQLGSNYLMHSYKHWFYLSATHRLVLVTTADVFEKNMTTVLLYLVVSSQFSPEVLVLCGFGLSLEV